MPAVLTGTPREDGFAMPAEWAPHKQTWMLWPQRPDNWRDQARPAQAAFARVVRAIAEFEPVTVGATEHAFASARDRLGDSARVVEIANNDAWARDTGPTFVTDGSGTVRANDWAFNAWGGELGGLYTDWSDDDRVAARICELEGIDRYRTGDFVLEGGSIHVDGEGTLLTTEECLLNDNRNPHLTRPAIEQRLRDHLGVDTVLWLPDGLYHDETNGHVDNFACFLRPGVVALAWTDDAASPQYQRCRRALDYLEAHRDAHGRTLHVVKLPLPGPLRYTADEVAGLTPVDGTLPRRAGDVMAGSYVNCLMVNGGLILPAFDDPHDQQAANILADHCPDRRVVQVPGREVLLGGGNIHCITQQQPQG